MSMKRAKDADTTGAIATSKAKDGGGSWSGNNYSVNGKTIAWVVPFSKSSRWGVVVNAPLAPDKSFHSLGQAKAWIEQNAEAMYTKYITAAKDALPAPVPVRGSSVDRKAKDRVLGRGAVGDDLMSAKSEQRLNSERAKAGNKGVEAYGVKGFKRTRWRKAFKSVEAMNKWVDDNDAEVYGTRNSAEDVLPVPANSMNDGHLAEIKKAWNSKIYAHYRAIYNAEGKAAADKYLQQFTTRKVGDLKPAPVKDTEWTDPKPKGKYGLTTSAVLRTPEAVAAAYGKKDPEGFKKSFGKDAGGEWRDGRGPTSAGEYFIGGKFAGHVEQLGTNKYDAETESGKHSLHSSVSAAKRWVENTLNRAYDRALPRPV